MRGQRKIKTPLTKTAAINCGIFGTTLGGMRDVESKPEASSGNSTARIGKHGQKCGKSPLDKIGGAGPPLETESH